MNPKNSGQDEVKRQLAIFKDGLVDLISEEELVSKIKKSLSSKKPLKIKYGVDPSASDIHLGHTVPLFKLKALQELGHQVIFLIGDFTARIGDPSHKSETRKVLSKKEVSQNAKTYTDQVFKILDKKKTKVVYNSDWLEGMKSEEFLKLTAHTTVHRMIERDDFKNRFELKRSISLMEFMYPLLQAYDSVHLKCDIELGGTDQKFNLLMGRELQRDYGGEAQIVMTLPILEGTDGVQKMSKSLGNAIGINLAPQEMFGRIMSLPDKLMLSFLKYATALPAEKVAAAEDRLKAGENPRNLKAELGRTLVAFYHDEKSAQAASDQFDKQFRDKQTPDDIPETILKGNYPEGKANLLQFSQESADLGLSGSEIRRLVKQGAVKVNGKTIQDAAELLDMTQELVIQYGKRKFRKYLPPARH